jgi:hypothetical protein
VDTVVRTQHPPEVAVLALPDEVEVELAERGRKTGRILDGRAPPAARLAVLLPSAPPSLVGWHLLLPLACGRDRVR